MCVKRLLLSLTSLLRYDTHTHTHIHTHTLTYTITWHYFTHQRKKRNRNILLFIVVQGKKLNKQHTIWRRKDNEKRKKKLEIQNCFPWLTPKPALHAIIFNALTLLPKLKHKEYTQKAHVTFPSAFLHAMILLPMSCATLKHAINRYFD